MIIVSKSDYILFRECKKNVWLKKHRPDIYDKSGLSEFEKSIIETGNEVELLARKLFPAGVLIEGRGREAQELTQDYLVAMTKGTRLSRRRLLAMTEMEGAGSRIECGMTDDQTTLFQPIFVRDGFLAAVDILEYDTEKGGYNIYEVKATNEIKEKIHFYDLAFQVNLLRKCEVNPVRSRPAEGSATSTLGRPASNGVEVRGIPMPAQTVMFITDTFTLKKQAEKNIHYLLPDQEKDRSENNALFLYLK